MPPTTVTRPRPPSRSPNNTSSHQIRGASEGSQLRRTERASAMQQVSPPGFHGLPGFSGSADHAIVSVRSPDSQAVTTDSKVSNPARKSAFQHGGFAVRWFANIKPSILNQCTHNLRIAQPRRQSDPQLRLAGIMGLFVDTGGDDLESRRLSGCVGDAPAPEHLSIHRFASREFF